MPDQHTQEDISLVSDEINEVLGSAPSWIMRWGSVVLLGSILLLFCLACFIRYPDVIYGEATLTPVAPAADIIIPPGVTVMAVYVRDGQLVSKGQPLLLQHRQDTVTVKAPIDGKLVLQQLLDTTRPFTRETLLMSIIPSQQQYYATVVLPATGLGKVHMGQRVDIALSNYPVDEFGSISGTVWSRPQPAAGNTATIAVRLDKGCITSHRKKLDIDKATAGQAGIITEDKRLLQRILGFLN